MQQPNDKSTEAIERLKRNSDFIEFSKFLKDVREGLRGQVEQLRGEERVEAAGGSRALTMLLAICSPEASDGTNAIPTPRAESLG